MSPGLSHAFPRPERLARADLATLGMPAARARALSAMAAASVADPGSSPPARASVRHQTARRPPRHRRVDGLLHRHARLARAGRLPAADIGLARALADGSGTRLNAAELAARAEAWRPWRAYAAMYLWTADRHAPAAPVPHMEIRDAFTIDRLSTLIGTLLLVCDEDGRVRTRFRRLRGADAAPAEDALRRSDARTGPAPTPVRRALDAYFAGDLGAIDEIPVATGGTPFQRTVWAALHRIPAGTTTSYGALAVTIGRPSAMRAVGLAVGSNPVAVIVPCHG